LTRDPGDAQHGREAGGSWGAPSICHGKPSEVDAIMLKRRTGLLSSVDGERFIQAERGEPGFVLLGPFKPYRAGSYSVTFNITPQSDEVGADGYCGWVDVADNGTRTRIIEKTNLFAERLRRERGQVMLPFNLDRPARLRFRVYSSGTVPLKVSTDTKVSPDSDNRYLPILPPEVQPPNKFFKSNFSRLRSVYENGVELGLGERIVARCGGLSFYICTADACQLVNGIFFGNMYNFSSMRNVLAIDIGMNIGLTSLYMAQDPRVVEVHAFEPFRVPFDRAIDNFGLNPALAPKITPINVGLGDANQTLHVRSDPERTIGRSIKGLLTGTPETITVRNTAEVFPGLIAKAKANGCDVVTKIDCEGSEFAIFDALKEARLLHEIRAFMVEWHKKGSKDGSQSDIVAPLIANNFMIFDRTNPNKASGMLYAVRTD
jgi:FkbM family methyltransferase